MPRVNFTLKIDCDTDRPERFLLMYDGEILESEDNSDEDVRIGTVTVYLLQRTRLLNEGESAFEAMDVLTLFSNVGQWSESLEEEKE